MERFSRSAASSPLGGRPSSPLTRIATPELVKAQLQVRSLKRKLDSESNAADSQLIRQERLLTDAQRELESALLRLEKVERDRAFLFERSKTFEEELNAERQTALSLRQEQTSTIQSLQKDKGSLVEELAEQRRAAASHRSETARLLQDKEAQIGRLQALVNAKDSKTQEAITSLKSKNELIDQLRTQLGALESQESAPKSGLLTREEGEAMQSQMRENLAHIKKLDSHVLSLKKENAHYKALDLNLSKKDEQVTSLEAQLLTLTQLRKELAETQVENASLKQERAKWASFSGDADPVSMARNLATERFRVAELQELLGVEKAEKAGRESYIKRLEDNAHSFERTLSTIKSQSDKLAIQIRVLERQKRLAERESTFLREQLKSYDMEDSVAGNQTDQKKEARIQELESLLTEYKNMSLEIQLRGAVKQEENHMTLDRYSPEARKKLDDMQDSISALKMEKGMLEKHVESLESQVHELERALGRGEVDLSKTRVLMLKDNPSSQADQVRWEELQSLRAENQALRDSSVSAGGIPTESVHVFETKINELQQELSSKEKRMVRLKEVLNARVQEFREAICSILGFRVDMMPQGTIKFSSIYSPQRHFEFDSKGALLFGGDGEDLRPGLEKYYETSHVPAFMSWVTLHFFESPM